MLKEIGIIVGVLGFCLSVALFYIDLRRRRSGLRLVVNSSELFGFSDGVAYARVYLSLINRATIPRTVYRLRFREVEGIRIGLVPGLPNLVDRIVTYSPGAESWVEPFQLLLADIASWPLDVEPQRSRSFYEVLTVAPISPPSPDGKGVERTIAIPVRAEDENGKALATSELRVPTYAP